jgi:5-methylcytosine-specific restriction endonuclease McrA
MSQYKACLDCKQLKDFDQFHNRSSSKDGKYTYCKSCFSQRNKISRAKNPERIKREVAKWRESNKEQVIKTKKAWRVKNKAIIINQKRAWVKNNPEKIKQMYQRSYAKNPELFILNANKRSKRLKSVEVNLITTKDYARLYKMPCIYCGSNLKIEVDHIQPINKNGRHSIGNLAAACRSCNRSKSDLFVMEWRLRQAKGNPPEPKP